MLPQRGVLGRRGLRPRGRSAVPEGVEGAMVVPPGLRVPWQKGLDAVEEGHHGLCSEDGVS